MTEPRSPKLNLVEQLAGRVGMAEAAPAFVPEPTPAAPAPVVPAPSQPQSAAAPAARPAGRRVTLELERLRRLGMVVPGSERTRLSEEFRLIKRPLLRNAFGAASVGRHGNLIMVTSARIGEGKTFSAINLAMSMVSESDLNVLLIDADVVRPSVMATLGLTDERGLIEAVSGDIGLADALVRCDNLPNLTLLPAGRAFSHVTELLASRRMADFMSDIAARYPDRVVIIDGPPVLATSETSVLALHVGQIVMVVGADTSGPKTVNAALKLVASCPSISLMLNRVSERRRPGDFGTQRYDARTHGD